MTSPVTPLGMTDVLATSYGNIQAPPEATLENSALLLIDIQHLAEPAYLLGNAVKAGLQAEDVKAALIDYEARFNAALKTSRAVLEAARAAGIPPIHVKIQALSHQARDTSLLHSRMGWLYPPSSPATRFLEPTKPQPDEIVITKTASGAFTGTGLDSTLRNMGIEHVFLCGFMTDECVETTARVALDLGYVVQIIEDATATYHAESHHATIDQFQSYGFTQPASKTIASFQQMAMRAAP